MEKHYINKLYNGHRVYRMFDPYNPLNLPSNTIRVKFKSGFTPVAGNVKTLVDSTNNIWDITYYTNDWFTLFHSNTDLLEVLGANTTNVTRMNHLFVKCSALSSVSLFDTTNVYDMQWMFGFCNSLSSVPLYDTSNVGNISHMFSNCTSLTSVPLFDTSNVGLMEGVFGGCGSLSSVPLFNTSKVVTMQNMFIGTSLTSIPLFDTSKLQDMDWMFYGCGNVQSGALALYQQVSTQSIPPSSHSQTFYNCGSNTQTGSAELAQIPSDWK